MEFLPTSVLSGAAVAAIFICVHADRGLIAAPSRPASLSLDVLWEQRLVGLLLARAIAHRSSYPSSD